MFTRRDQLQSYQFLMQRVVSALSIRDTDPVTPPFRRFIVSAACGVVAAALIMAGAGIYGLINPGGNEDWRAGDRVIIERETGAQYIYQNGKLYRIANYTSGVLLLGSNSEAVDVARASLMGVPRGPEIGIAGAPNGLPPADKLLGAPWTLCSRIVRDENGTDLASTILVIGGEASGGTPVGRDAFLAEDLETGALHLVVDGHRHLVRDEAAAMTGLALSQVPRVPTGTAWLNALPAGVDLAPPAVPGRGAPSAFPGARVGQLMVVRTANGTAQYYLAVADGLRSITEVEFALLFAATTTRAAYPDGMPREPRQISASEAAAAAVPSEPVPGGEQLPVTRPRMSAVVDANAAPCARFGDLTAPVDITVGARLPQVPSSELITARRTNAGTVIADRVLVAPGQGALVEAVQGRDAPGVVHLLTEQGVRYPLSSPDVVETLGYDLSTVVKLPAELVARVAEGVTLDPEWAGTVLLQR